jgi:hypothetical protein
MRARKSVVLENFGSRHKENFREAVSLSGMDKSTSDYRMALATFDEITGDLETPVNVGIADIGSKVRKMADMALLGKAVFSSVVDVANAASTFRWAGLTTGNAEAEIIKSIGRAVKRGLDGDTRWEPNEERF